MPQNEEQGPWADYQSGGAAVAEEGPWQDFSKGGAKTDLSQVKLSPYEQAVEAHGGMKPESGMESGTEFLTGLASAGKAALAPLLERPAGPEIPRSLAPPEPAMQAGPLGFVPPPSMIAGKPMAPEKQEQIAEEAMSMSPLNIFEPVQGKTIGGQILAAPYNVALGVGKFITSPMGVTAGMAGGGTAAKALWAGLMAKEAGEKLGGAKNLQDYLEGILSAGFAGGTALHRALPYEPPRNLLESLMREKPQLPRAFMEALRMQREKGAIDATQERQQQKDVSAERQGDDQVRAPTEAGVGGGVQPSPKVGGEVAKEGQTRVLLSPEDQAYLDAERGGIDRDVVVGEEHLDENQPFSPNSVATINRKTGKVVINPKEFSGWLNDLRARGLTPKQIGQAVRSTLGEEGIHLAVSDTMADLYWDQLTAFEKALEHKLYTGEWSRAAANQVHGRFFSDRDIAHEAVRRRMQRLARMKSTEVAEVIGRERWSRQSLELMGDVVRKVRELVKSPTPEQSAIFDRIQANINMGIVAKGGTPSKLRTQQDLPEPLKGDHWVTIERKDGSRYPAAINPDKFYDLSELGRGKVLQTTVPGTVEGTWSHGLQPEGSKIIEDGGKGAFEGKAEPGALRRKAEEHEGIPDDDFYRVRADLTGQREEGEADPFVPEGHGGILVDGKAIDDQAVQSVGAKIILYGYEKTRADLEKQINQFESFKDPAKYARYTPFKEELKGELRALKSLQGKVLQTDAEWHREHPNWQPEKPPPPPQDPNQLNLFGSEPSALRRRPESSEQGVMFLPPVPRGTEIQRPSAAEAGAKIPNRLEIEKASYAYLQDAADKALSAFEADPTKAPDIPDFKSFWRHMQNNIGGLQEGHALEFFERNLWRMLANASGRKLEAFRKALKLEGKLGTRTVGDPVSRPREERELRFKSGSFPGMVEDARIERELSREGKKARLAGARYRANVIAQIGAKIIEKAGEDMEPQITEVSAEDLRYGDTETKEPVVWQVTHDDMQNPKELGAKLVADARRRADDPENLTRRLTLLLDKQTMKAYLVSTYKHGRQGPVLRDPSLKVAKKVHRPLGQMLDRYRPITSIMLDKPVKNFMQEFSSLGDYEARLGTDARRAAEPMMAEPPKVEGAEEAPGSWERTSPMTEPEAAGILDHIFNYQGEFNGPEDVIAALGSLRESLELSVKHREDVLKQAEEQVRKSGLPQARVTEEPPLERPWTALSGFRKLAAHLEKQNPDLSWEELRDKLAEKVYETYKSTPSHGDFAQRILQETTAEGREAARPRPEQTLAQKLLREQALRSQAKSGARELAMPRSIPPTVTQRGEVLPKGAGPKPFIGGVKQPAALRRGPIADEIQATKETLQETVKNWSLVDRAAYEADNVGNKVNIYAAQQGWRARLASIVKPAGKWDQLTTPWQRGNPQVLSAANVLLQAGFDRSRIDTPQSIETEVEDANGNLTTVTTTIPSFMELVQQGIARARARARSPFWQERKLAAAELRTGLMYLKELRYARDHWDDHDLQTTATRIAHEYDRRLRELKRAGINVKHEAGFDPQRYDATLLHPKSFLGKMMRKQPQVLGTRTLDPRRYHSYYEAFGNGPFLPATRDSASLLEHYLRRTGTMLAREQWTDALKAMTTPSGLTLAADAVQTPKGWRPHQVGYEVVNTGGAPLSVHPDYAWRIRRLSDWRGVEDVPVLGAALRLSQALKHSILVGDFFHLGRVGYYGLGIMGRKAGFQSGWSVLDIGERDAAEAVRKGVIRQKDLDWANQPVQYGTASITRRDLAQKFYSEFGANLGRIEDALYKDLITTLSPTSGPLRRASVRLLDPSIGRYNRFLFDKLTRGIMAEANVREYERQIKAKPTANPDVLMRDIARDVNNFFGNIGKQGWFKSKTEMDLARMLFLAPQWVEGLVKKEAIAYSRLSQMSRLAGARQGKTALGTTGKAIGQSMLLMAGITQAINLITRHQPTWMNEEEGHKADAWIPGWGADDEGFWLSPLAIFNEVSHDIYRLLNSKPTAADAFAQILGNKEQPITRAVMTFITGYSPYGQKLTTTANRIGTSLAQMAPVPISFGRFGQAAGHAIAPNLVAPAPPGALGRQIAATAGVKIEPKESDVAEMSRMAQRWVKEEGLEKSKGWMQVQTDEPSYSKLRAAVRLGDERGFRKNLEALRKNHTDAEIMQSMSRWTRAGFTGSRKNEQDFKSSLDEQQLDLYDRAQEHKQRLYEDFLELFWKNS